MNKKCFDSLFVLISKDNFFLNVAKEYINHGVTSV